MPERTERDETVDRAIELLISEDTEAFVTVGVEAEDVHIAGSSSEVDHDLLAVFMVVEHARRRFEELGKSFTPGDIVGAAGAAAEQRGLLDSEARFIDRSGSADPRRP